MFWSEEEAEPKRVLTLTYEIWILADRTRSQKQDAEMSFFPRVSGLRLRDKVRINKYKKD